MANHNPKHKKKIEYKPIPFNDIPEGIQLCIKNTERLYDDAMFLLKNDRIASAKVNFILAKEEFAKGIFLLSQYKQKKTISKSQVKKHFQHHLIRLEEFREYLKDIKDMPIMIFPAEYDRDTREHHTYVDWKGNGHWFSPSYFIIPPLEIKRKKITSQSDFFETFDLKTAYSKLSKDMDFQKIMKMKRSRPPLNEIRDIVSNVIGDGIPTKSEVTNERILIKIKPKQGITQNMIKTLRKSLDEKYSNYKVKIRFGE